MMIVGLDLGIGSRQDLVISLDFGFREKVHRRFRFLACTFH